MQRLINKYTLLLMGVLTIWSCRKTLDLQTYNAGTAVTLTVSSATVAPTLADSNRNVVSFSWTNPNYAQDTSLYKYVLEIDSAGRNFVQKKQYTVIGTRSKSLTGRELNDIALANGFVLGTPTELEARVISSYGNNNEPYISNAVRFRLTAFADPSNLTVNSNSATLQLSQINNSALTFNWNRSFTGFNGRITYFIQYDSSGKNFSSPRDVRIGVDTLTKAFTHGELNNQALAEGVAGGSVGRLEYRVRATTAAGGTVFSNVVSVLLNTYAPPTRLFIVGGSTPIGWTPTAALELIKDSRYPGVYYAYTFLDPSGGGFKFLSQQADWSAAGQTIYGDVSGAGNTGNLTSTNGGENIKPATAGVYRIVADVVNGRYYINTATANGIGGMGIIGQFQGWSQPALKMDYISYNRFNYLVSMSNNDEFKLHDGNAWDNSQVGFSRWFGLSGPTLTLDPGNLSPLKWTGVSGLTRVIFDGTQVTNNTPVLRYTHIPGALYLIGGDPNLGNWNNDAANNSMPALTHQGNGVWTGTVSVSSAAPFKLVVQKGLWDIQWGNSTNAPLVAGTARAMAFRYYDNDPATFQFPAAGTYAITVDEYAGTITIN